MIDSASKTPPSRWREGRRDSIALEYLPFGLGMMVVGVVIWLFLRSSILEAVILALSSVLVWFASRVLRFGAAGVSAAAPTIIFLVIVFFVPIEYRVDREFFTAAAQCIPVLFIAFAIESGVVKHRTRGEVKLLAVLLAILLTIGEAVALSGLAVLDMTDATVLHLTVTVAALAAGFISIIISMLIREPSDVNGVAEAALLDRRDMSGAESRGPGPRGTPPRGAKSADHSDVTVAKRYYPAGQAGKGLTMIVGAFFAGAVAWATISRRR